MSDHLTPAESGVEIRLAGEENPLFLKCTVDAALKLCSLPGGIHSVNPDASCVTSRLLDLHLPTMAAIVRIGLDLGPNAVKTLERQIYETGLFEMRDQLAPYVGMVKNGGRPIAADDAAPAGGDAPGEENPQKP